MPTTPLPPPPPPPPSTGPVDRSLGPVRPSRGISLAWLAMGSALALLLVSLATAQVVGLLGHEETTQTERFDATGLDRLDIETAGGTVRVVGGDVDEVEVRAKISRGITETRYQQEVRGSALAIRVGCGNQLANHWCQVTLDIVVPRALDVRVRAWADPVHVTDVDGRVEVRSSDEPIYLDGLGGPIRARADNAAIRATDLAAPRADAFSENGSVLLRYRSPPTSVVAGSSNGNVAIELPPDDQSYAVVTASNNGDENTVVRTDPASERTVSARSANGDVVVRYLS